jgi:hypothetical protein
MKYKEKLLILYFKHFHIIDFILNNHKNYEFMIEMG